VYLVNECCILGSRLEFHTAYADFIHSSYKCALAHKLLSTLREEAKDSVHQSPQKMREVYLGLDQEISLAHSIDFGMPMFSIPRNSNYFRCFNVLLYPSDVISYRGRCSKTA
jgi:hypothetical protein